MGPKDSNFVALVRAVRGTGSNKTIARFPLQANYPLESQLSQLSTDGTKLFVIDATRRLRLYDLRGSVKTVNVTRPSGAKVRLREVAPGYTLPLPSPPFIVGLTPSFDGQSIVTIAQDGILCITSSSSGAIQHWSSLPPIWWKAFLQFSPSGRHLIIGGNTDTGSALYLADAQTLQVKTAFVTKLETVEGVGFSRQGDQILCWGDGGLEVFRAST